MTARSRRMILRAFLKPRAARRAHHASRSKNLLLGGLAVASALLLVPERASAQDTRALSITLAPMVTAEPGVETALAIAPSPQEGIPPQSFVRLRGLPHSARLSEGHVIAPGSWAVPLLGIANLKILAPVEAAGRSDISVAIVSVEGQVLAESRSTLIVAPAWLLAQGQGAADARQAAPAASPASRGEARGAGGSSATLPKSATERVPERAARAPEQPSAAAPAQQPAVAALPEPAAQARAPDPAPQPAAPPEQPSAPAQSAAPAQQPSGPAAAGTKSAQVQTSATTAAPQAALPGAPVNPRSAELKREMAENAGRFLRRGVEQLRMGSVAEARAFFQRAAELGSADAALLLAATYDPEEIRRMRLIGPQPDLAAARRWYERARELGAPEAEFRLSRLGSGG